MKIAGATPNASHPAVISVEIRAPEDANAGIDIIDVQAVQLQASPLMSRRVVVRLDDATVVYHSCNMRLRSRSRVREDLLAFVVFGPQAKGMVAGLPVRPGLMLTVPPDAEVDFVVGAGWESVSILIPPESVGSWGGAGFRRPQGIAMLEADSDQVLRLFEWGKRLADTAARQPEAFIRPGAQLDIAEAELPERLVAVLASAVAHRPNRTDLKRRTQYHIVCIAEDTAMSRVGSGFYVKDMCDAAGVSERTLEYAFRDVMGLTPLAFLTRLRLHRVRLALLSAAPKSTTVTTVAQHWGFGHLGEFARAYKDLFGELPSQTLTRRGEEAPGIEAS